MVDGGGFYINDTDKYALQVAVDHYCLCPPNGPGTVVCAAHQLLKEPGVVQHLLYGRRLSQQFRNEEFHVA